MQTEDNHEKEPEVISTVGQNDAMSKVKLTEFPSQKELMEKELEGRSRGNRLFFFLSPALTNTCHTIFKQ